MPFTRFFMTAARKYSTHRFPTPISTLRRRIMKQLIHGIFTFFRVAPWPALLSVLCAAAALLLGAQALGHHNQGNISIALAFGFPTLGWAGLGLIALLDALARHIDYRRIRRLLERYGFRRRVFVVVAPSRCQRDAALHAARRTGHLLQARAVFRGLGYRWYHLLPDRVMDNPLRFFDPAFLRQAFLPSQGRS